VAEGNEIPGRNRLPYNRAFDGLRGVAVALVLLYHGGVAGTRGGYLGVTMFFTLSGFLITSLLVVEHDRDGRISLRRFWGRRVRRLVPALLLCFPLVAIVVARSPQAPGHGLMADAAAGALWFENWRLVLAHQSYADLFSLPSPFQHFWSLAVEEQYYLIFPLLTVLLLGRRGRRGLALVLGQLVVVSVALGVFFAAHSPTITRAYYGTDSRIAEILLGALLALALTRADGVRQMSSRLRHVLDAGAIVALAVLGILVRSLAYGDPRLFHGGLLLAAACTAVVIAAASQSGALTHRLLSLPPLAPLGVISYGVYLFHWPLFLALTTRNTGAHGLELLVLRIGATVALAAVSYVVLEAPIRAAGPMRVGPAATTWAFSAAAGLAVVALAAGVIQLPSLTTRSPSAAVAAPTLGQAPAAAGRAASGRSSQRTATAGQRVYGAPSNAAPAGTVHHRQARARTVIPQEFIGDGEDYSKAPAMPDVPAGALKILVVGDSIGNNLGRGLTFWARDRSDVAVYNLAIPACPVSRGGERRIDPDTLLPIKPWCDWWADSTSPRYQAMQQFSPDVVLVEDGINALFERKLATWSDWERPGVPQFDNWMTSEYQTFVDAFRNLRSKVVIANAPCGDWANYFPTITDGPQRVRALDKLVYPTVVTDGSADFFNEVCPNGQYSDTVDGVADARPDGFHFTDEAATALARDWLGPLLIKAGSATIGGLPGG
jgi:peptidoglycan/LPS O-acetylase OafA/YrhL